MKENPASFDFGLLLPCGKRLADGLNRWWLGSCRSTECRLARMKFAQCLLVLLLLLAGNIHAEILNKCVSGSGTVSWQATACGQGTRVMKTLEYTPDPPTAVAVPHPVRTTVTKSRTRASTRYRVSTRTTRRKSNACARAHERRDVTLERVGLKRNYDLLSKLDADVRSVCR